MTMFFVYFTLVTMVTGTLGCSPPIGGFVPPTPAKMVHGSVHVLIGTVTSKIDVDPLFPNVGDTSYGATVSVHCTYKGDNLPKTITIGGAGFIPGLCFSKDLVVDKTYVIFLSAAQDRDGKTLYEQSYTAKADTDIVNFLDVCGLKRVSTTKVDRWKYTKQYVCPPTKNKVTCKEYDPVSGSTNTVQKAGKP